MQNGVRRKIDHLKVKDFNLEAGFRVCFGQENGLSFGLSFILIGCVVFEKFAVKVAKPKLPKCWPELPAFALMA